MFSLVRHSAEILLTPAAVNSQDNASPRSPGGRWRGPGGGEACLQPETRSLYSASASAQSLHMHLSPNVQECLIWLRPFGKEEEGGWGVGGQRGERLLACHCIIPAAINSLCPAAE